MEKDTWSANEKETICSMQKEAPALDYPLQRVQCLDGHYEEMYFIPMEDRVKVFKACWPFETSVEFKEDTIFVDVHSKAFFRVTDMRILRYANRNVIVSPEYPLTGGMVVDLVYPETLSDILDEDTEEKSVIVSKVKGKKYQSGHRTGK